jgi:hypothetical protein
MKFHNAMDHELNEITSMFDGEALTQEEHDLIMELKARETNVEK